MIFPENWFSLFGIMRRPCSRPIFGVLLELLLKRGELGEWGIGLRLLVAAVGIATVRLGVILLTLSALYAVAFVAAGRTVAALRVVFTLDALALALDALLPLVPILTLLAIFALDVRRRRIRRFFRDFRGHWRRHCIGRRRCCGFRGYYGRLLLRALRTTRTISSLLEPAGRAPDFDEDRFRTRHVILIRLLGHGCF